MQEPGGKKAAGRTGSADFPRMSKNPAEARMSEAWLLGRKGRRGEGAKGRRGEGSDGFRLAVGAMSGVFELRRIPGGHAEFGGDFVELDDFRMGEEQATGLI